jgi:hypothetical protein
LMEEGILIRPAAKSAHTEAAETPVADLVPVAKAQGLRALLSRLRRDDKSRRKL